MSNEIKRIVPSVVSRIEKEQEDSQEEESEEEKSETESEKSKEVLTQEVLATRRILKVKGVKAQP